MPTTQPVLPKVGIELRAENRVVVMPPQVFAKDISNGGILGSPSGGVIQVQIPGPILQRWLAPDGENRVWVGIAGMDDRFQYSINPADHLGKDVGPMVLIEPKSGGGILPWKNEVTGQEQVIYTGPMGVHGPKLLGKEHKTGENARRIALYQFRNLNLPPAASDGTTTLAFELKVHAEIDKGEITAEEEITDVTVSLRDPASGKLTQSTHVSPDTNRPVYFEMPAAAGGLDQNNFDVVLESNTAAAITLHAGQNASLRLVRQNQWFAFNLFKSLLILWLLSVLVAVISVMCSTLVSWPIAVILALFLLAGRWCVDSLGELAKPGVGSSVATQLFATQNPGITRAVSKSVDQLAWLLDTVSSVLPQIDRYSAMEELNRGAAISWQTVRGAFDVTWMFGLPLLVLGWMRLRYMEVAP